MKDFNEIYQKTSEEVKAKLAKQTPKKFYQQTSFKIFFVIAIIVLIFAIIIKLPILFFGYLILALILFAIGFTGLVISKNLIKALICIELIMSAINLNFIAFTSFKNYIFLKGMVFSLFITAVSAVQSAIGLVLIYLIFKNRKTLMSEEIEELKG